MLTKISNSFFILTIRKLILNIIRKRPLNTPYEFIL